MWLALSVRDSGHLTEGDAGERCRSDQRCETSSLCDAKGLVMELRGGGGRELTLKSIVIRRRSIITTGPKGPGPGVEMSHLGGVEVGRYRLTFTTSEIVAFIKTS